MKKIIFLLLAEFFVTGCEKTFMPCIDHVRNDPGKQLVSQKDLDTAIKILHLLKIPLTNLQIYHFSTGGNIYRIDCHQYLHGYTCFNEDITYELYKDYSIATISGRILSDSMVSKRTVKFSEIQAARAFKEKIETDTYQKNNSSQYMKNCFKGELGFYNINIFVNTLSANLVIAWKVTPSDRDTPVLYLDAETGKEIYFWNGVFTVW